MEKSHAVGSEANNPGLQADHHVRTVHVQRVEQQLRNLYKN